MWEYRTKISCVIKLTKMEMKLKKINKKVKK